jgi:hypothetical protein
MQRLGNALLIGYIHLGVSDAANMTINGGHLAGRLKIGIGVGIRRR